MKNFKSTSLLIVTLLFVFSVVAQKDKNKRKSPPAQVSKEINGKKITIDYSRPSKRGRKIFGELEKYGKVWRTGANETTWIEVSKDVRVDGNTLSAGKYALFTIPGEDEWVIIFNENWNDWGADQYDKSKDVLRIKVKPVKTSKVTELFTIDIQKNGDVSLIWDTVKVGFSIR